MDKIEEIYENYKEVIQEFGINKIKQRYMDIHQAYEEFIENLEISDKVVVNTYILMHAIMDYFTDISRLKSFHKIDYTNSYKTTAYEISWLLRRKPLQVMVDEQEDLVYINEKFVLSYTMSFLTRNQPEDFYDILDKNRQKGLDGFMESLYYYFKYRNCNAQSLEMALLSFEAGMNICPQISEEKKQ